MSEQWGRWFADPPQAEEPPNEVAVEERAEPEAVEEYQSVDEYEQASSADENVSMDEYQSSDDQVAEHEAVTEDESFAVAEPLDEPVAEDESFAVEQLDSTAVQDETDDDGDPAVSAVYALRQRLGELEELPIEEHPARYESLHAELTAALGKIDGGA